jgi:hypothetical protein
MYFSIKNHYSLLCFGSNVPDSLMAVSKPFLGLSVRLQTKTVMKRSKTVMERSCKRPGTLEPINDPFRGSFVIGMVHKFFFHPSRILLG